MYWRIEATPQRGMRFSRNEVIQILVAVAAMTLAFTLAFVGGLGGLSAFFRSASPLGVGILVGSSFVAVITAFLLHELAHKIVAQRYGCFAEFRAYPMGLLLGVATAAMGFLFAAPGAVMVSGAVDARQNGRISAAGPGTNLVLGGGFVALAAVLNAGTFQSDFVPFLIASVGFVNIFLGGFNMIPFPPLDGSKIFAYSKPLWVGMLAAIIAVYAAGAWLRVF